MGAPKNKPLEFEFTGFLGPQSPFASLLRRLDSRDFKGLQVVCRGSRYVGDFCFRLSFTRTGRVFNCTVADGKRFVRLLKENITLSDTIGSLSSVDIEEFHCFLSHDEHEGMSREEVYAILISAVFALKLSHHEVFLKEL